jgi:hypothetical protein
MDESKLDAHAVGNGRRTLRTAGVRADDDGILVVRDVCLDVPLEERPAVQIIDGNVKKSLH